MTLTFEQARDIVANNAPGRDRDEFMVATWGWGNDDYFTIPSGHRVTVYGPASPEEAELLSNDDAPVNLVDRNTGEFTLVPGLFGALPYSDMVKVGYGDPEDDE